MAGTDTNRTLLKTFTVLAAAVCAAGLLFFLPHLLVRGAADPPAVFTVLEQDGMDGEVSLTGSFDRDIPENETVWLFAENAAVTLTWNGESTVYHAYGETPPAFRSPGSGWFRARSPGIRAGEPVALTVRSYYGDSVRAAESLLDYLYVGDGSGLYQRMQGRVDLFLIVFLSALVAGAIYMIEGAVDTLQGMYAAGSRIFAFGAYAFTGGLWCALDALYPYFNLLIEPSWAASFLDMAGLLLFPIALAFMIRCFIRGSHTRRVMGAVVLVEAATAAVCLICQLTGAADLFEQQLFIGIVAMASLAAAIACIAVDLRRYRDQYLFLLLLTVLPVFAAVLVDGINILWPFMPRRVMMRHGFCISIFLLLFQLVSYAKAEAARVEKIKRMERELENSRITIMLSQIQPHFLYNSLLGIKQLCDVEPQRASDALEHFSYYLRGNLDTLVDAQLIPFEKEIEHVNHYLHLEKMRFSKKLTVRMELLYTDFFLPPLTIQSLAENAVRYGIMKKRGGGTLVVRSEQTEEGARVTISDDGVGFDPSASPEDGRSHVGIKNVRSRLMAQCGGTLTIESEKGTGTTVKIVLPRKEALS